MGLLDFMKRRKEELPLPPPPPRAQSSQAHAQFPIESDIEPIRPQMPPAQAAPEPAEFEFDDLPELPQQVSEYAAPEPVLQAAPEPINVREVPARDEEVFDGSLLPKDYEPPARKRPSKSFIAVDDYKKIVDESNRVRAKVSEADALLKELKGIRDHEEKLFSKWQSQVEGIEKKLSHVDQIIGNAQR